MIHSKPGKAGDLDPSAVEKRFEECLAEVSKSLRSLELVVPALVRAHRDGTRRNPGFKESLPKSPKSREKGGPSEGRRKKA